MRFVTCLMTVLTSVSFGVRAGRRIVTTGVSQVLRGLGAPEPYSMACEFTEDAVGKGLCIPLAGEGEIDNPQGHELRLITHTPHELAFVADGLKSREHGFKLFGIEGEIAGDDRHHTSTSLAVR
jgi:hypothetical protein